MINTIPGTPNSHAIKYFPTIILLKISPARVRNRRGKLASAIPTNL